MNEAKELHARVIKEDYCIGCGACTTVKNSPFKVKMNEYGNIIAYPVYGLDSNDAKVLEICPFSDYAKNEDELSKIFFPDVVQNDNRIGKYIDCYAGHVKTGRFRERGSSGGMGKWLGYILLFKGRIDYLIQVVPNQTNDPTKPLFGYRVIDKSEDVLTGSKSSYYPVSLTEAVHFIENNKGSYAITGVPCFIKALRLLSLQDSKIKSRIKYTIGIVCGGMKSANQSKMIAWQLGVKPDDLTAIDFRRKYNDRSPKQKIYQVWSQKDNMERCRDSYEIYGTDWGAGYFKPNACDYCDDVVAETADISIGDAWLPDFEKDPDGSSVIVVRNHELNRIIQDSIQGDELILKKLTAEEVATSQAGGLRHRREGLSYRLGKKTLRGVNVPRKRVKPFQYDLSKKRKRMFDLREKIAANSHIAFLKALEAGDLNILYREMRKLDRKYHALLYGNIFQRGIRKIRRILFSITGN